VHLLTHEFYPRRGGIATYTLGLALAAAEAGYETHVWAPQAHELSAQDWPFTIHELPFPGREDWSDRWALRRTLRSAAVDWRQAQICLVDPGPLRLWLYQPWLDLPQPAALSLVLHGSELNRCIRWPHRHLLLKALLRRARRVGVVSNYVGHTYLRHYAARPGQLVRVPGAPLPGFQQVQAEREEHPRLRLLTVARIHRRKGQHRVMQALGLLPPDLRRRWDYLIVGPSRDTAYRSELERLARQHGLRVNFAGAVPDAALPQFYAAADVFVLASEPHGASVEGLGLVLLEAAAAGLPVLGTRTGGIPEAVAHNVNGLLVSPGNVTALAAALERLTTDTALRHRLGQAGPEWVRTHFSWQRNVQALFSDDVPPPCNFPPATGSN